VDFRVCNALKIKPFQALLRNAPFCSLGEVGGAGAGLLNPVPRFRRRNGNGKNPDGQGFKNGDFFAPHAKKYYSSLDGLDRRNGHKTGIVFGDEMCYIL